MRVDEYVEITLSSRKTRKQRRIDELHRSWTHPTR